MHVLLIVFCHAHYLFYNQGFILHKTNNQFSNYEVKN